MQVRSDKIDAETDAGHQAKCLQRVGPDQRFDAAPVRVEPHEDHRHRHVPHKGHMQRPEIPVTASRGRPDRPSRQPRSFSTERRTKPRSGTTRCRNGSPDTGRSTRAPSGKKEESARTRSRAAPPRTRAPSANRRTGWPAPSPEPTRKSLPRYSIRSSRTRRRARASGGYRRKSPDCPPVGPTGWPRDRAPENKRLR